MGMNGSFYHYNMKDIGCVTTGRESLGDSKPLSKCEFEIGDYLDVAISLPGSRLNISVLFNFKLGSTLTMLKGMTVDAVNVEVPEGEGVLVVDEDQDLTSSKFAKGIIFHYFNGTINIKWGDY